jgi:hypothetical protein
MKLLQAKNIFEASRFYFLLNKLIGFVFVTCTQDSSGNIIFESSIFDFVWFIFSFGFFSWSFYDFAGIGELIKTQSMILNLGIMMNMKISSLQPIVLVVLNFVNRKNFVAILKNFNWIDLKVGEFFHESSSAHLISFSSFAT